MCYNNFETRLLGKIGRHLLDSLDIARHIVEVVEDNKAEDILLLDLRPETIIADFFVICNGNSDRQIKALVEHVREAAKETFGRLPYSTEGTAESGWVLMDFGEIVVHIFLEDKRRYYDLEGLWRAESSILLKIQ